MDKPLIEGLAELRANLQTLSTRIEKKVLGKALRAGAKLEQNQAKQNVPVVSGQTRRAVKVRSMKRKKGRVGVSVTLAGSSFSEAFYASFPEYGTKKQPAQNNLKQAAEQTHPKALEIFKQEAGKGIEIEAAKGK